MEDVPIGSTAGLPARPLAATRGWEVRSVAAVLLLALVARLAWGLATRSWVFPNVWAFGYEMGEIASHLASGNGFRMHWATGHPAELSAWMPPLYPFFMAGVFESFGIFSRTSAVVLELFQTLISALTCVAVYALGKRLYSPKVGLLASLLFAVYPGAIYFSVEKIWSTALFALLVIVLLLMILRLRDRPRPREGLALGGMLGLITLLDPVVLGLLPYALLRLWRDGVGDRRVIAKTIAVILVSLCLVAAPWLARNHAVFGRFVFIKSNFGHELYLGNNVASDGFYDPRLNEELEGPIPTALLTAAERDTLLNANEVVANELYLRRGLDFIAGHPLRFLELTFRRVVIFWTRHRPVTGWLDEAWTAGGVATFALAVAGLLLGRGLCHRDRRLVAGCLLWFPLAYYLTIAGLSRYRFPVEPVLVVFAAHALYRAGCALRERLPRRLRPLFQAEVGA